MWFEVEEGREGGTDGWKEEGKKERKMENMTALSGEMEDNIRRSNILIDFLGWEKQKIMERQYLEK